MSAVVGISYIVIYIYNGKNWKIGSVHSTH